MQSCPSCRRVGGIRLSNDTTSGSCGMPASMLERLSVSLSTTTVMVSSSSDVDRVFKSVTSTRSACCASPWWQIAGVAHVGCRPHARHVANVSPSPTPNPKAIKFTLDSTLAEMFNSTSPTRRSVCRSPRSTTSTTRRGARRQAGASHRPARRARVHARRGAARWRGGRDSGRRVRPRPWLRRRRRSPDRARRR